MKDNFSARSGTYAAFRPRYSTALAAYLAALTPARQLAWDCATGNGQFATLLADYFDRVVATDMSANQLAQAAPHERIEYRQESAEQSTLATQSVDLLTVAQAVHWFEFDTFFAEVRRVLRPNGIIALIGYPLMRFENPAIHAAVNDFYTHTTGPYWDAERSHLDALYTTIPFPFAPITDVPAFVLEYEWSLETLTGYLNSWSAVQHYQRQHGHGPVEDFIRSLQPLWPANDRVDVAFDLIVKVGRND